MVLGFLWLLDYFAYLPLFSVFFGKTETRGYKHPNRRFERTVHALWVLSCAGLMLGGPLWRLWASAFFYVLYRHYYIDSRWSSIRRGGGAPGFMNHWAAAALLLLQFAAFLDATGWLAAQALWVVRVDFAVIMICAGTYKFMVGYWNGEGMEYGRVNPFWGYWWRHFQQRPATGAYVAVTNFLASATELVSGILLLFPATRLAGALLVTISFVFVALHIRLGRLAWLMAALPLLYHPDLLPSLVAATPVHVEFPFVGPLGALAWLYVGMLPIVKAMQYFNLFARRSLPRPWQDGFSRYANAVPIIIWRVFTADVTNFYVRIYEVDAAGRRPVLDETVFTLKQWREPWTQLRYWHVTEAIALVSVFTTLKYFPDNRAMFEQKLLRYSASLQRSVSRLVYEYVSIQKAHDRFTFVHVASFSVDLAAQTVVEEKLEPGFDYAAPPKFSPLRTSQAPGVFTPVS